MGKMLLGMAAAIAGSVIFASPAVAGTPEDAFVGIPNANPPTTAIAGGVQFGLGGGFHTGFGHGGFGDGDFKGVRRHRGSGASHGVWVNGGQWAQYNNEAFRSNSYNDWWHDSPRSQPAWVRNNQDCSRQWFAGDTLRC